MKRPLSLRTRLVGLTLLAVALVWLLTAVLTWREARHELEELLAHPPETSSAHLAADREQAAGEIAEHLLEPLLYALPALALLLVIAIGLALGPLRKLAREVSARAPDRLDPLPSESVPAEVAPLVGRLNSLFADIVRALDNERRFTADAAHELRTPLAALRAQAQVALASVDHDERQHALTQILVGCDRATHLVTQLLTLARLDADSALALGDIALRPIAEHVLALSAGEAIERRCELALLDGDARVRGDASLLQALLGNLVDNALRHSGGAQIEVSITRRQGQAVLRVSDDGRGIAEDERGRVAQRFYRSASADSPGGGGSAPGAGGRENAGAADLAIRSSTGGSGSGLGLSIVKRIVELHHGTMEIRPAGSGSGVSFVVCLPLAESTGE